MLLTYRRSEAAARAVVDEIAARGGDAVAVRADLGTRAGCEALVAEASERLGGLDVWVNNAGADVLTGDAAGWDWERKLDLLLAVDVKGTIACSYAAGAVMREQAGGGTIVNMSWDHVTSGMAGADPEVFSAVKGGVLAYSKSLARALAPSVRVNVVCPGWIETAFARACRRRLPALGGRVHAAGPLGDSGRRRRGGAVSGVAGARHSSPDRRSTSTVAL